MQTKEHPQKQLEGDVDYKNQLISFLNLRLLEQNRRLKELAKIWKRLGLTGEKYAVFEKTLNATIENKLLWEQFIKHFSEIHPEFVKQLNKQATTALSAENIRMCTYIKIGFTNNEIASFMNILPNSVKRTHSRIKRKLQLPKNQSLRKFIQTLEN